MSSRAAFLATALACCALASTATADDGPAVAVQGHVLVSPEAELGGALSADLWVPIDIFRVGGFFGVAGLPSAEDTLNRVFMPVGPSVGVEALGDPIGFSLRLRGGLWGGATQDAKLAAGGFVGGGAYILFAMGAGVSFSAGLDVWGIFGDGQTVLFAPGVGLTWNPMHGAD